MSTKRVKRLNSLIKEVISEVILKEVRNPDISPLVTVTKVEITQDLFQAKVYISVIGEEEEKNKTLKALESASGFIGVHASKKVVMKYFPTLTFILDKSVEEQMKIEKILQDIQSEKKSRNGNS